MDEKKSEESSQQEAKNKPLPEDKKNLAEPQSTEQEKVTDKPLIIGAIVIVGLFLIVLSTFFFFKSGPKTIEEMHLLNLEGKLKPEQGYVYNGVYSFININDVWYTQLVSPGGAKLYDLGFRYGPKDVEGIEINGWINATSFDNDAEVYVTFDPLGKDFAHVTLAIGDFDMHMISAFDKEIIAACDKNETEGCSSRPIITCENTNKSVLYIKEDPVSEINLYKNCIMIKGTGFDLVKNVDRVLYRFYGIMN